MTSCIEIPSVCLPRVWYNFDKNYIEAIFCELFGPDATGDSCVKRIDMITKKDRNTDEDFWVVFVHFSAFMHPTEFLVDFVDRINNDEEVKIQYNPPWFWKVRKNKGARKQRSRQGPRIMSREDEEQLMATQKEILEQQEYSLNTSSQDNDTLMKNIPPPSQLKRASVTEN